MYSCKGMSVEAKVLRLPDVLAVKAELIADRVAHDDTRSVMTLSEWHHESDKLGGGLKAAGLQVGARVILPISNDNAVEMAIAAIAVMKGGGIAVPVNTRLSEDEFIEYCNLIEPQFAITNVPEKLNHLNLEKVWLATDLPANIDALPDQSQWGGYTDALIMSTSGTTGKIKGVVIKHADLTERLGDGRHFDKRGNSTLHALPFTGTGGMQGECLLPILTGQTCYTQPRFEPGEFLKLIKEKRPTTLYFVPTMLRLVLDHPDAGKADLSSVRNILTGTAPLQRDSVLRALKLWPHVRIRNSYGMSEGGIGVGTSSNEMVLKPGCVGKMPDNMQIRDKTSSVVAEGVVGEIYGYQKTQRRYWRDEEATSKGWVGGWTKTGDLGYVDEQGDLILSGRSKELIIRGGYNITPIEIENVIHDHPAVKEAAVLGVPHDVLGEDVAAAVTLNQGQTVTAEEIMDFCRDHLADNKVPRIVVFFDSLPKNQSEKILKRELQPVLAKQAEAARLARHDNSKG